MKTITISLLALTAFILGIWIIFRLNEYFWMNVMRDGNVAFRNTQISRAVMSLVYIGYVVKAVHKAVRTRSRRPGGTAQ